MKRTKTSGGCNFLLQRKDWDNFLNIWCFRIFGFNEWSYGLLRPYYKSTNCIKQRVGINVSFYQSPNRRRRMRRRMKSTHRWTHASTHAWPCVDSVQRIFMWIYWLNPENFAWPCVDSVPNHFSAQKSMNACVDAWNRRIDERMRRRMVHHASIRALIISSSFQLHLCFMLFETYENNIADLTTKYVKTGGHKIVEDFNDTIVSYMTS